MYKGKILVTGGEGRFAKVLKEKNKLLNLHFATKKNCNILKLRSIENIVKKDIDPNDLKKIVDTNNLGLNFENCIKNKNVEDYILEDRVEGVKKFKIEATPTLIINNKKFDKPLNYKNLKKTLKKLI